MNNFQIADFSEFQLVDPYNLSGYPGWSVLGVFPDSKWETIYVNGSSNSVEKNASKLLIGKRSDSVAGVLKAQLDTFFRNKIRKTILVNY
jgi:hypothetical protein